MTPQEKIVEAQQLLREAAALKAGEPVLAAVQRYNGALEEYRAKYGKTKRKHYTLYRFRDDEDNLLYVGMTRTFINRMKNHAMDKDWWEDVSYITVEHYPDAESLRQAELHAIATENPLHNQADLPMPAKPLVSHQ
ncbi:endonuclease [Mycobacterium phage Send513]|uniref:Endonuclease n=1 Tax=Mycobacterium phage Send513 TaxID=1034146 RepID=G1BRR6_9CAUD|nr:endonuclease [Mycobacterium phage Send513]AEK07532.1 endonuclease [Mycobacterium phage Send513]